MPTQIFSYTDNCPRIFIGFDYIEYFKNLYGNDVTVWLRTNNVEPLYPLNRNPGGDLLNRILALIDESKCALFDCSTLNPNVMFELGWTIGRQQLPFFITYNKDHTEGQPLPTLFKTQWGVWYDSLDNLKAQLKSIIAIKYEKGHYDFRTNKTISDKKEFAINPYSICVIINNNTDYSFELRSIQEIWPLTKVDTYCIEQYNNLDNLVEIIGSYHVIIAFLVPILEKTNLQFIQNNEINARTMFVAGIAKGMDKYLLLFQHGTSDYSDVFGLANHYNSLPEFRSIVDTWNNVSTAKLFKGIVSDRRIGIPNLGKLIERKRLNKYIHAQLFSKPILLRASSGYGKSALIVQYLRIYPQINIWYTFDKNIKEFADFFIEIIAALNRIDPQIGRIIHPIMASFSKKEISEKNLCAYLLNELKSFGKKVLLILDDIHLVKNCTIYTHICSFIGQLPQNVGLLLLSRENIEDSNNKIESKYFVELDKSELEFNPDEVRDYVESILGFSLSNSELDLLTKKTEGWIASISLLQSLVAKYDKKGISEIIARLSGKDVKIYNYFADIVYDSFFDEEKELLLRTSLLNNITPSSVSFLLNTDETKAGQLLKNLEGKNSFLFTFENQPNQYKYHSLFKEFLEEKHRLAVGAESINLLKYKLAGYCYTHRDLIDAIRYGIDGGNHSIAIKAISQSGNIILNEGMGKMLSDWISRIPTEFFNNDSNVLIIKGRSEEQVGDIINAKATYEKAQALLSQQSDKDKDKLLVRLLMLQIDLVQEQDLSILEHEAQYIRENAIRLVDYNFYFAATDIYFDIMWKSLLKQHRIRDPQLEEYDKLIQQINVALTELVEYPLAEKNIHRCQLLANKVRLLNFINGLKTARIITKIKLAEMSGNSPGYEKRKEWLKDINERDKEEAQCLDEALLLSENEAPILNANMLVERAEIMTGKYQFHAMILRQPPLKYLDPMLTDYNNALNIYSKFDHKYGIASVYNNVSKLFLLKDDKSNRDKYAHLAINIATEYGFKAILTSAESILEMPTLSEMMNSAIAATQKDLANGISKEDKDQFVNMMLQSVDGLNTEEKERRRAVLIMELDDLEHVKYLNKYWCKYLQLFDTHNSLEKHPRIDSEMIKAYLEEEQFAIDLYDNAKQDFGSQSIAKFLYCAVQRVYSDELEERTQSLSNKFISKYCKECPKKEI